MFGHCRRAVEAGVTTELAIGAKNRDVFWISSLHLSQHLFAKGQYINERCLSRCFRFLHERIQNRKHEIANRWIGPKICVRLRSDIVDLASSSLVENFQPKALIKQNGRVGKAQRRRSITAEP